MKNTFVIALDDEAAAFLDSRANGDANAYLNGLLERACARQEASGKPRKAREIIEETPDASGYPEMDGHFRSPEAP